jgi:hypothetical protein
MGGRLVDVIGAESSVDEVAQYTASAAHAKVVRSTTGLDIPMEINTDAIRRLRDYLLSHGKLRLDDDGRRPTAAMGRAAQEPIPGPAQPLPAGSNHSPRPCSWS